MKLSVYSIYDKVAEVFNKPFTDINDATATRNFNASIENERHKDDYELYCLGGFNDNSGMLEPASPRRIKSGLEVKKPELELIESN